MHGCSADPPRVPSVRLTGGGGLNLDLFFFKWGFIAQELTSGEPFEVLNAGFRVLDIETPVPTVFTIFTSMFMHGGFMHLAGNMMFLWVFGDNIEHRLGHVNNYLLLGLFFCVFIVPAGLVLRLLGRDPMCRGFDAKAPTYWTPVTRRTDAETLRDMF